LSSASWRAEDREGGQAKLKAIWAQAILMIESMIGKS
jgi:hypothetical protein